MRIDFRGIAPFALAGAVLIGFAVWYLGSGDDPAVDRAKELRSRRIAERPAARKERARKSRPDARKIRESPASTARRGERPVVDLEAEEEAKLTAQHRQLLTDIRAALDADNKKRMIALIQKMQKLEEWPDGIPSILKKTAIEAMAWFGADCLPELAGFFADGDPEIVEDVVSRYDEALSDPELTPEQISQLLVVASQFVHDSDAMDSMLTSLNELPHSLAVKTIETIMEKGTSETKKVLPDNIDFYTGEENLHTPEALEEWLEQHPDEHDDQVVE